MNSIYFDAEPLSSAPSPGRPGGWCSLEFNNGLPCGVSGRFFPVFFDVLHIRRNFEYFLIQFLRDNRPERSLSVCCRSWRSWNESWRWI